MAEIIKYAHGTPSWVDLGAPDVDAAAHFYSELFGWNVLEAGPVEETGGYRMAFLRGMPVAGLGPQMSPEGSWWTTYVSVDDADAITKVIEAAGGSVMMEPMDVMTVGRMGIFADPAGAGFAVWQPLDHIGAGIVNEPGTFTWSELSTRDAAAASPFYEQVFGWTAKATDMGGMTYTEFQLGDSSIAGMMPMPESTPAGVPSHWLVYFAVADCDASVAKIGSLGGAIVVPAMDMPVGRFAVAADLGGATFGIIQLAS
jgi:predicted enzyme related to lactoylglutathione lyase